MIWIILLAMTAAAVMSPASPISSDRVAATKAERSKPGSMALSDKEEVERL